MKNIKNILVLTGMFASSFFPFFETQASVPDWQKGASFLPITSTTEYASDKMKRSLDNLAGTHANYASLIIPYYQSNIYSADLTPGWNTPTDEALVSAIKYAHSIGLRVVVKPHLESFGGEWRALINPTDRTAWFNAYQKMLLHYATIAEQNGVEDFCLGAELVSVTHPAINASNTANWVNMIHAVRGIYHGKITYSANWSGDEAQGIQFWNELDYVGLSAYFNLNLMTDSSVASLKASWDVQNKQSISPLHDKLGKPIVFTELGYRSVPDAYKSPWAWFEAGSYDGVVQANLYEALMSYWNDYSWMQGVQLWKWSVDPNDGGPGNTDYTPQHKPAEDVMKKWFGMTAVAVPRDVNPTQINVSAKLSPSPAKVNDSVALSIGVTANSTIQNGVIDIEIYSSAGEKVFQKILSQQNLTTPQTYNLTWAPTKEGAYSVKVGIFSNDWTTLYQWIDNASTITVVPSNSQTIGDGNINVWWPTANAHLTGVTPFKSILQGRNVDSYKMFWQVEGDRWNDMWTSTAEYPHKEASVNLSEWTWKNSGPYNINFITQDNNGTKLSEKAFQIYSGN